MNMAIRVVVLQMFYFYTETWGHKWSNLINTFQMGWNDQLAIERDCLKMYSYFPIEHEHVSFPCWVTRGVSRVISPSKKRMPLPARSIVKPRGEMVAPVSIFEIHVGFCGRNLEFLSVELYQLKTNWSPIKTRGHHCPPKGRLCTGAYPRKIQHTPRPQATGKLFMKGIPW